VQDQEPEDLAVHARGLRKAYRVRGTEVPAVDGLDLQVRRGEFFGVLGPNGSGKSTTVGMLTTRTTPTGGTATVAGHDVRRDPVRVRRSIGVVTQANTLDRAVTLAQNLELRCRVFGLDRRSARRRSADLLAQFGLADVADRLDDHVSGGQSKRAMIARAVVHRPDVLFLDEPTAAVDPQSRRDLWDLLRALHRDGQTVLLTTHHLEEAEALCDRVAVLDHGRVLACDTVAGIKRRSGADHVVEVGLAGTPDTALVQEGLRRIPGVRAVEVDLRSVRVHAVPRGAAGVGEAGAGEDGVGEDLVGDVLQALAVTGPGIRTVTSTPPSLENAFLNLTGRSYSA
jgi:ABC-2 type transport system ATP-binding protein